MEAPLRLATCFLLTVLLPAQSVDPEEVLDIVTVRVEENLRQLPDYACELTLDRYRKIRRHGRFRPQDTVRLEVGYIEGVEMFSFPGQSRFDAEIPAHVAVGTFSTGSFALHLRNVFLSGEAQVRYHGREEVDGTMCHRYYYRVPNESGLYKLNANGKTADVGYHGEFWIDVDTLDIFRTLLVLDDVPETMNIEGVRETTEYQRIRMGKGNALLPVGGVMTLVAGNGSADRNYQRYSACREFRGESAVSFLEPGEEPVVESPPPVPPPVSPVPPGLIIELQLQHEIDSTKSKVGDEILAKVRVDVMQNDQVVIPKRALAMGRLLHLRRAVGDRRTYMLALDFEVIEFGSTRMALRGELLTFVPQQRPGLTLTGPQDRRDQNLKLPIIGELPFASVATARSKHSKLRIPKRTIMVWRSF